MKPLTAPQKIYRAFYNSRQAKLYYNQLKGITGLSDSSLQNALKKLEDNKEIVIDKQKSNTFYSLRNKALTALRFTEFDYDRLKHLSRDIAIPVRNFISQSPEGISFIILFGSASRNQERKDSDIDILVVLYEFSNSELQKKYEQEMKKEIEKLKDRISATSIYPLSVLYTTSSEFKNSPDRLIAETRNTGFCIKGNLTYYEAILDE